MTGSALVVTKILSILTILGGVLALVLIVAMIFRKSVYGRMAENIISQSGTLLAFLVSLAAMAASFYYSSVVGFLPCNLCWWQRVFLFPQVFILGLGIFTRDSGARKYAILLSWIGILIAAYNSYLQFGGKSPLPCVVGGISCAQRYFLEFGYVTIPTMSLTAFALILIFLSFRRKED